MNHNPFQPYEPLKNEQEKKTTQPDTHTVYPDKESEAQQTADFSNLQNEPTAQQRHASEQSAYTPQDVYTPYSAPADFSQDIYSAAPKENENTHDLFGGYDDSTAYVPNPQQPPTYTYTEPVTGTRPSAAEYADDYNGAATGYSTEYTQPGSQTPYQTNAVTTTDGAYTRPGARYTTQPGKPQKEKKTKKKGAGRGFVTTAVVIGVLASGVLGFGGGWLANNLGESGVISSGNGLTIQKVVNTAEGTTQSGGEGMSTAQIAEATADSVVEITTEVVQTGSFSQQYIQSGAGSGVIISENGYILTNNHVIDGATKITVTLKSGKSYDATLIGTAASVLDVALLKIEANGLTPVVMGDSDSLKVGEKTVVIGNPLGQLGGTVTDGIVSALNRDLSIDGVTMNLLQTNAAINPGNSGGGMFNEKGELIGLVVAKSTGSEVEGLGFAIPINQITNILDDLTEYGYVRGNIDLGISMLDITSEQMAMMYGVSETGVYVLSINEGSTAQSAGFQRGDKILSIDGTQVNSSSEVEAVIKKHKVGDTVTIEVKRGGQTGELTLTLEEDIPDSLSSGNTGGAFGENGGNANENNGENKNDGNNGYSIEDFLNNLF